MVREGLGITLSPRMMLPKKLEGVLALPFDPPQPLQIGLAVRSQEMASPGAKLFVQTALAWTQEQASPLPQAR
jgi:DNA-binding transcriptional LysR family regulator